MIPLNDQTSGEKKKKKNDRNLPVMFGRRIAKFLANPHRPRIFLIKSPPCLFIKISVLSLARPNFLTGAISYPESSGFLVSGSSPVATLG